MLHDCVAGGFPVRADCKMQIFAQIRPAEAMEELIELHQAFSDSKILVKQGECFHNRLLQNNTGVFGKKLQQVLLEPFNGLLNLFGSFDDTTENR